MQKLLFSLLIILAFGYGASAQKPTEPDGAQILLKLKKLNFLGNVLYLAAHPDDENTKLIAYYANEKLANTAYMALTRGDGGQNLIGADIREALGVIRTQELLAARRIDGGHQYFSRANDFGYSKTADETLEIWDKDQVLSDVVWVYRKFRPDVIITRFPPDARAGHGHHTTSAIMAQEAFKIANDPSQYKDQLKYVETWQPKRLYTNTGRWWNPDMTGQEEGVLTVDAGTYNPLLGKSYTEIAANSRSQHKSQGFGTTGTRGEEKEFLEYVMGDKAEVDILEGIDTSWKRVKGGEPIGELVAQAIAKFNASNPSAVLPLLIEARQKITALNDPFWKEQKRVEIDEVIRDVCGLYLEVVASDFEYTPRSSASLSVEAINRSGADVKLVSIDFAGVKDTVVNVSLANNIDQHLATTMVIPNNKSYSQPYWLRDKGTLGMYRVDDRTLIGKPENDPALDATFKLEINGEEIIYKRPVVFKKNDPVKGESYRPVAITPPVFVNIDKGVYIFPDENKRDVTVNLKGVKSDISGHVTLELPEGWTSVPSAFDYDLVKKGEEKSFTFAVYPTKKQSSGEVKAAVEVGGKKYSYSLNEIDYEHIPTQMLMMPSVAKVVKLDIKKAGEKIAYIQGAGDDIPNALREIGYQVTEFTDEQVNHINFESFDAVILGVRALNTNERISFYMPELLEYAKNGGTLIVQYNTNYRLKTDHFAPYDLTLSRDRVTEEDAEVRVLDKKNPVLNYPNKITSDDFEGWVQERGLYFPNQWDSHYTAVLSSNDKNEKDSPKNGGLLVAKYGKGYYIYTGYSWFRELPAGVAGAYRLFVNLVSVGAQDEK